MREGLSRLALGLAVAALAAVVWGQGFVTYLNGIAYTFPSSQGAADEILTASDGAGGLAWDDPPNSAGIVSGMIVLSTVSCPAGWTRLSAADGRFLRGSDTEGTTGGSDTHPHTLSGILTATAVSVTGSTGSSAPSISGSLATASVSHSHPYSDSTTGANTPPGAAGAQSFTIFSADPSHSHGDGSYAGASHSHGDGSLAGGSHGHAVGTYALASESSVPAYYNLLVCEKD